MARTIHKGLLWEKNYANKNLWQVKVLSDVLYSIDETFGKDWNDKNGGYKARFWTYSSGIQFDQLTREEFKKVKSFIPNLSVLDKHSNEHGFRLTGTFGQGYKKDQTMSKGINSWSCSIAFAWGLPDSCKVIRKEVISPADAETYYVDAVTGNIMQKRIQGDVQCDGPIMDAIFNG